MSSLKEPGEYYKDIKGRIWQIDEYGRWIYRVKERKCGWVERGVVWHGYYNYEPWYWEFGNSHGKEDTAIAAMDAASNKE